ncbi:hypothetical protein V1527DRAFT_522355 [Lipomyces starkeyi]
MRCILCFFAGRSLLFLLSIPIMSQSSAFSLGGFLMGRAAQHKVVRSARVSSWHQKGLNQDAFVVLPGDTAVLADLEGPGTCRRIVGPGLIPYSKSGVAMMEIHTALGLNYKVNDPDYYRKVLMKMYWDDEESPSVLAPIGDFSCVGHSMAANMQSMPFTVSVKPSEEKNLARTRIEIENQNDKAYFQYFYIDYELWPEPLIKDTLYFDAHWHRENPTNGWAPPEIQINSLETQVPNLDGKSNYVILETEGAGSYIGCNHSVAHFQGTWWGLFHGWGMQKNQFRFCGTIIHEEDVPNYQVSYRWQLPDPVRFNKKIKVTTESGHANHLRDDWSTTAYWYQTLPGPKLDILPVEQRLPRRPEFPPCRLRLLECRANDSRERARNNVKLAQDIRRRFLASLK